MNFFTTKKRSSTTEESEAMMIRDLEAPLLSENEKKKSESVVMVHTAVPLQLKTKNNEDNDESSLSSSLYDDMPAQISRYEHSLGCKLDHADVSSPPCQGPVTKRNTSKVVTHVHSSPPCQGLVTKRNSSKVVTHVHSSPPCQGYSEVARASKEEENDDDDDDGDECDGIVIDIDSVTTVIDARCNILNGTYLIGFLLGLILQACSLYVVNMVTPVNTAGSASSAASAGSSGNGGMGMSVIFALYFFSRYWALLALLLPPIVCTMSEKFHRSSKARRRANRINKKNKNKNVTTSCLETFFECVRFQFGLFFGSLILLSIVNFYTLAQTAPLCMLLAYYGVCVVVSLFALCLLQLFVNQVCANISSVEIVVSYDKDEDDDEDDDENDDKDDDE